MTVSKVVALCGGVGGAKLALGLQSALPAGALTVIVNTGDDFEHFGLAISPDLDTVLYTLAGLENPETGWGRRNETWTFMEVIETLADVGWFRLGDGDLALHVERTRRLREGERLSEIMADMARRWSVTSRILPMTDDKVRTIVETEEGELPFQHYFVKRRAEPRVTGIRFAGAEVSRANGDALAALASPETAAVIICPSNPYLSIDPLLALPDLRSALASAPAKVVAVTPIVGGRALKGPTAKIMAELALSVSARTVCSHYDGLIDGFVLDHADSELAATIDVPTLVTDTVMRTWDDKTRLACAVIGFAQALTADPAAREVAS